MRNSKITLGRDLSYKDKLAIMDGVNDIGFTLSVSGGIYPAKLIGCKCEWPLVYCVNELGQTIDVQISWSLAIRIYNGEVDNVNG